MVGVLVFLVCSDSENTTLRFCPASRTPCYGIAPLGPPGDQKLADGEVHRPRLELRAAGCPQQRGEAEEEEPDAQVEGNDLDRREDYDEGKLTGGGLGPAMGGTAMT